MDKVYIVTSGEYSDYSIERFFSTKELAQEYLDHIGNDGNASIEEYDIDVATPSGLFAYCVTIPDDGCDTNVFIYDFKRRPNLCKDAFQWVDETQFLQDRGIWFNIEAKSARHAIKISSERLMQIKAMPYLFPLLKKKCVFSKSEYKGISTPIYNYKTRDILLDEDEWIELSNM